MGASKRIRLNVAGCIYETFSETLNRFPHTLLGDEKRRMNYFDPLTNVYFINHSSIAFDSILFFYQSNGRLTRPPLLPMELFEEECIFYDLDRAAIKSMKILEGFDEEEPQNKTEFINLTKLQKVWQFVEVPESSCLARIFASLSLILIIFIVAVDCFSTLESIRNSALTNLLNSITKYGNFFFLFEFLTRLISSPSKLKFVRSISNVVDFFAIFPSLLFVTLEENQMGSVLFIRVLRTFRILRLLRLSKNFQALAAVLEILSNCLTDLLMLVFFMTISATLLGSVIYYAESGNKNSPISSVPEGMWLAIQTIVTLGYGDVIPITVLGKLSTAFTAAVGALTMILPLLSLGGKYISMHSKKFKVTMIDINIPTKSKK